MAIATEIDLRLPNSPGALAGVCGILSAERINVLAMALEATGHLRLVVDNRVRAAAALRERHHHVVEREVIVVDVPDAPGGVSPVTALLADAGVNIEYAYGGGAGPGRAATVVFGVDDALRAATRAGV